ncbi:MAG: YbaK/EbsC family protein [Candidatus Komeilibacteria bacterium]|nr:YbaK/EbsC family protein [Candidatus Komeilibacteria bacterium]
MHSKLEKKIESTGTRATVIEHRKVFTAYDAAQTMRRKLEEIVKTLLVQGGEQFYLVHVPANKNIDLKKLAKVIGVNKVTIPKEKALLKQLKIKPGKMAAFGFVYKLPDVVDKNLRKAKKVIFASGELTASLEMSVSDFLKLTDQYIEGVFTVAKKLPKPASRQKSKPKTKSKKKTATKKVVKKKSSKIIKRRRQ